MKSPSETAPSVRRLRRSRQTVPPSTALTSLHRRRLLGSAEVAVGHPAPRRETGIVGFARAPGGRVAVGGLRRRARRLRHFAAHVLRDRSPSRVGGGRRSRMTRRSLPYRPRCRSEPAETRRARRSRGERGQRRRGRRNFDPDIGEVALELARGTRWRYAAGISPRHRRPSRACSLEHVDDLVRHRLSAAHQEMRARRSAHQPEMSPRAWGLPAVASRPFMPDEDDAVGRFPRFCPSRSLSAANSITPRHARTVRACARHDERAPSAAYRGMTARHQPSSADPPAHARTLHAERQHERPRPSSCLASPAAYSACEEAACGRRRSGRSERARRGAPPRRLAPEEPAT